MNKSDLMSRINKVSRQQNNRFDISCNRKFTAPVGANLRYADLRGADLRYANLRGANLIDIKTNMHTIGYNLACPEEGSFVGYKKAGKCIVKLLILEDAKRSSATNNPFPALASSFFPPFSPFSRQKVKNFPITGLSLPHSKTFLAKR